MTDHLDCKSYNNTVSGFATSPVVITNCIAYEGVIDKAPSLISRIKNTLLRKWFKP